MFKFFFKPYYSIFEYICLPLIVSMMLSGMWILAFLLVVPIALVQILANIKLEKEETKS